MKITNINQQVKRKDRYSIYVDGKYAFSLSEHELMMQGLYIGQEFNNVEFVKIKKTAVEDKAYMRALDLLARRPRSEWELKQYLKNKDYDNHTIVKILNMLNKRGLLNDKKFATVWIENRRLLKNVSKRRLKQELQQKHISSHIISEVLTQDQVDEKEVLRQIIAKKQTQSRYEDQQKLMNYLLRQGFDYADIKESLYAKDDI